MPAGHARRRALAPARPGRLAALAPAMLLAGCGPVFGPRAFDLMLMVGLVAAVVLIALSVYGGRNPRTQQPGPRSIPPAVPPGPASARELLDWRYAAGEIDRDAWQTGVADLRERDSRRRGVEP